MEHLLGLKTNQLFANQANTHRKASVAFEYIPQPVDYFVLFGNSRIQMEPSQSDVLIDNGRVVVLCQI